MTPDWVTYVLQYVVAPGLAATGAYFASRPSKKKLDAVEGEMRTNGGSSLRDAVNDIKDAVEDLKERMGKLEERPRIALFAWRR